MRLPSVPRATAVVLLSLLTQQIALAAAQTFQFGRAPAPAHATAVAADHLFNRERGFGFEPGAALTTADTFIASDRPFYFTARVPHEGNYRVTVALGRPDAAALTTIKAELRRLVVADAIPTAGGETKRVSFIVNTRTPAIASVADLKPGAVRLKAPRETIQEAWAWDDAITLEFCNARPAVRSITIEPVEVPTIFLLGDSTVCDQSKEPYASWGQMFTRWFKPAVAIANHGESGETYRDSLARRRLDKIISALQPGDWLLMQFGHNDQKQIAAKTGGPFTTYRDEIKRHVAAVRARGGTPVLISPMERRGFDESGQVRPSLIDYARAARDTARELDVAFIDLNALSKTLYAALGVEQSALAFATAANGQLDNTHHNNFGAYLLAKCVVQAICDQRLPLAKFITDDFAPFDPAKPGAPETFVVPASGSFTNERPLGDER